jgi:hypothetical protein
LVGILPKTQKPARRTILYYHQSSCNFTSGIQLFKNPPGLTRLPTWVFVLSENSGLQISITGTSTALGIVLEAVLSSFLITGEDATDV